MNSQMILLVQQWISIIQSKKKVIESQNYEQAAKIRDGERNLLYEFIINMDTETKDEYEKFCEVNLITNAGFSSKDHMSQNRGAAIQNFEVFIKPYLIKKYDLNLELHNSYSEFREYKLKNILD